MYDIDGDDQILDSEQRSSEEEDSEIILDVQ